jgi:hypothetical protein
MRRHHQSHSLGLARINLNKHENRWIREQCTESRPVSYGIGAPRLYPDFWLAVVDKLKKLQWIKREDNRDLEDARFEKNTGNIETQPFCLCGWGQSSVKIKGLFYYIFLFDRWPCAEVDGRISTLDVCPLRIVEVRINITNIRSYLCVCVITTLLWPPKGEANPDPIALSSYFPFLMETQNRWILKE